MDFLESRSFPKVALHRDTKIRDRNLRVAGDERVFLLKLLSRHLATRQTLLVPRTRPALVALQCLEADRLHFHEGNLAVKPRRVKPREHFPQPAPVSEPGPAARHAQAQAGHDKAAMVTRSPGFHGGHFVFTLSCVSRCWCNSFTGLRGLPFHRHQLRGLDQIRNAHNRRLWCIVLHLPESAATRTWPRQWGKGNRSNVMREIRGYSNSYMSFFESPALTQRSRTPEGPPRIQYP